MVEQLLIVAAEEQRLLQLQGRGRGTLDLLLLVLENLLDREHFLEGEGQSLVVHRGLVDRYFSAFFRPGAKRPDAVLVLLRGIASREKAVEGLGVVEPLGVVPL